MQNLDNLISLKAISDNQRNKNALYFKIWRALHLDLPLMLGIFLLIVLDLFLLYTAGNKDIGIVIKQGFYFLLGASVMCFLAKIPPRFYQECANWIFSAMIVILTIVLIIGAISKGAQRWLSLGLFRFQPAEIMKIIMPMTLAAYLKNKSLPPNAKTIFLSLGLIFFPAFLVAKQPDLGTAIMIVLAGISILICSGINWRILLSSTLAVICSLPLFWHFMHDYQKKRVLTFLNPENDPLGSGYHIIQSKIAIGSGGFLGKGFLHGSQSHLQFLPEHTTDFIFAVWSEEFGLIGCLVLIGIFLYITARCLFISSQANDTFSRLLASGLSLIFFSAFFINIGMVIGILPVVGLPLPLISYGGSSVVTMMAGFGIIMSLHTHQKLLPSSS